MNEVDDWLEAAYEERFIADIDEDDYEETEEEEDDDEDDD